MYLKGLLSLLLFSSYPDSDPNQIELLFVSADIHTEAVQAALAKHKEEKMALPMPTKRRSTYVQSPIETRTPPGTVGQEGKGCSCNVVFRAR